MTSYKTCAVPMCRSTTIKCPDKLFIHVPKSPNFKVGIYIIDLRISYNVLYQYLYFGRYLHRSFCIPKLGRAKIRITGKEICDHKRIDSGQICTIRFNVA